MVTKRVINNGFFPSRFAILHQLTRSNGTNLNAVALLLRHLPVASLFCLFVFLWRKRKWTATLLSLAGKEIGVTMAAMNKLKFEKKSRGKVDIRDGCRKHRGKLSSKIRYQDRLKSEKRNERLFFPPLFFSLCSVALEFRGVFLQQHPGICIFTFARLFIDWISEMLIICYITAVWCAGQSRFNRSEMFDCFQSVRVEGMSRQCPVVSD